METDAHRNDQLSRRKLLQAGAVGAVAAGVATVGGARPAAADSQGTSGIHIHGSLAGGIPPVVSGRIIYITVYGPDDNLGGIGVDIEPETVGSMQAKRYHHTQCLYDAHGAAEGEIVRLSGIFLFVDNPVDDSVPIEIEANLATGAIKWTAITGGGPVPFEGTGVVIRI